MNPVTFGLALLVVGMLLGVAALQADERSKSSDQNVHNAQLRPQARLTRALAVISAVLVVCAVSILAIAARD